MSSAEAKAVVVPEPLGDPVMYHMAAPQRRLHPLRLCTGGELFNRIVKKDHYTERKAAELARVIVGVVKVCHSMDLGCRFKFIHQLGLHLSK
ncbi:hypothetical protein BDA96_09G113900 [Sorghum bicolor]|uniref:Protein kinase domain-containing protein n=1 Tax=Sorghum bicolor TaxID=4558 RepID=A0A921Q9Y4_SORBI|nr:hypothetical protein BDA96_09G113900 [Sorghum bicolor]